MLSLTEVSKTDLQIIKRVSLAIGKRSARLAAVAIAAIAIKTKSRNKEMKEMDVGVDGSLIEFFPNYQDYIQEAMSEIFEARGDRVTVNLGLARDGSGVGAALTALVSS
jgi:hexokinase